MRWKIYVTMLVLALMFTTVEYARMFVVGVPQGEPNSIEVSYGGSITLKLIDQAVTQDAGDPNVIVVTTKLKIIE